jgi:hypothetical protein
MWRHRVVAVNKNAGAINKKQIVNHTTRMDSRTNKKAKLTLGFQSNKTTIRICIAVVSPAE